MVRAVAVAVRRRRRFRRLRTFGALRLGRTRRARLGRILLLGLCRALRHRRRGRGHGRTQLQQQR
eukprot:3376277-Prymnesium_polylepis.1